MKAPLPLEAQRRRSGVLRIRPDTGVWGGLVVVAQIAWSPCTVAFDDVEGEAVVELHAGCAQNRAQRACGPALFADDFADVRRSNEEAKHGGICFADRFYADSGWVVDKSLSDFGYKGSHIGHASMAADGFNCLSHSYTSGEFAS